MRAAALVAAATAALGVGVAPSLAAPALSVSTSVSPRFLYLADTVTARVTVVADRRQADPAGIRVLATFGGWDQVAPTRLSQASAGRFYRRTWSFEIACLQATCLAAGKPLGVELPLVTVLAKRVDNSILTIHRAWPKLSLAPRFGRATPGATPAFELDQGLPRATYRVRPGGLALGLDAAAVLFTALGLWVVLLELRRRRPARRDDVPALVRALTFVRQAKARPIEDRRRAVGFLARTLERGRGASLAGTASEVAWSAGEPSPARLEELAQLVEAEGEDLR